MILMRFAKIATAMVLGAVFSPSPVQGGNGPVDFRHDLIPVLTKVGCNAGACHGAAIGRGGFKLSLYGVDPHADFEAIVRQMGGRRVNLSRPEDSLIVLKPGEYVEHGGGTVFNHDSESAHLLIEWVRQGAGYQSELSLKRVEITPRAHIAKSLGESVPLRAVAHYADGSARDVTRWTVFTTEDSSAVEVDSQAANVTALRRGRHVVIARYLKEVVPSELLVPLTDSEVVLSDESRHNFIDDEILKTLSILRLPASPLVDDANFLRRVSLDLTGRLPAKERIEVFCDDRGADKHKELVNELLESAESTEYWTLQLAKLLRIRPQEGDGDGASTYHAWLADQIRNGVSYRQLARTLIMATGDSHKYGPANFYRTVNGPRQQAEFFSELFMGSRLRCANCHNHPLDRWTQDDYHGLAAIFARVQMGKVVKEKPSGTVTRAVTLVDPSTPSRTLDVLGRCDRKESCEDSSSAIGGLPQKLHWFNGALLNARISVEGSRLRELLSAGREPMEIVHEFYLAALNRPPSPAEEQHWASLRNSFAA